MEDMLRVGVITSTHGLLGEVKVFPTTDDMTRFKKLKKGKLLNRAFSCAVDEAVYDGIAEEFLGK